MPKFVPYLIFMLLVLPSSALAKVEVNILNNGEGSTNSVKVNSNTSSNQNSSNTFDNETRIKINSNGEEKEYYGSDGVINMQSSDGKTTVNVNNNSVNKSPFPSSSSKSTIKTNITVNSSTSDSSSSAAPSPAVAGVFRDNLEKKPAGFWEYFKSQLTQLLKLFS